MIPATSQIGISITTKNRWEDLEITLKNLQAEGLDSLETIVIDDGSITPLPSQFTGQFPWVKFMRFESAGTSTQRNRAAQFLSTPLILQLDDDSFPIAGNLKVAASWLMEHPQVCALTLRMIGRDASFPADFAATPPFPVKALVGCCALIKRDRFLALGGYEERLGFYGEESEFCMRAFQQGQETYAYPAVVVRHRFAPGGGRNVRPRTRQHVRNYVLLCLWCFPFPLSHLRAIRYGPVQIVKNADLRRYWEDVLIGWLQGMLCYFSWRLEKKRLSMKQFHDWENLNSVGDGSAF